MSKRKRKVKTLPKNPVGRPTDYCEETVSRICIELSKGRSLRKTCEGDGMPTIMTVWNWLNKYPEFLSRYERAKAESADTLADEIVDIADEATRLKIPHQVQAARLRIDARKWIAAKLKPKKYGERIQTEVSGTMSLEQIVATTNVKEKSE